MDIKNYQQIPEKPLSYEEWKGSVAPSFDEERYKAMQRIHNIDARKDFDEMLKREYQEYLNNLNGNWLLK